MTNRIIRPRRSFIFTPGLRPDMFPKALASGADIVCVELEDGIAPKDKAEARKNALALFENPQADDGVERMVRINSMRERFGIDDLFEYWEQKARREERTWLALVKLILSWKRLPHPWPERLPHPLVDKICDFLYSEEEDQPRIQNGGL